MKILIEKLQNLQALYERDLRLLLSAEEMIAIKTPYLTERTTDSELHEVLRKEVEGAEAQAKRLREMLSRTKAESNPIKCKAIYALFDEAEELVEAASHDSVRDAVVISEAQRIKHYEIAVYGALRQFARVLGLMEDERLLNDTIHEEGEIDKQLSSIAERVNPMAKAA